MPVPPARGQLLVGPDAGFASDEVASAAREAVWRIALLGPTTPRAETAADRRDEPGARRDRTTSIDAATDGDQVTSDEEGAASATPSR